MPTDPNQNMAVSLALAGLAFVVTLIIGRPIITFLRQQKFGKQIRIDGPQTHLVKTRHADDGRDHGRVCRWS